MRDSKNYNGFLVHMILMYKKLTNFFIQTALATLFPFIEVQPTFSNELQPLVLFTSFHVVVVEERLPFNLKLLWKKLATSYLLQHLVILAVTDAAIGNL